MTSIASPYRSPDEAPGRLPVRMLDRLLDRSVVLGYTRMGPLLRRRWWPAGPPPDALRGKAVAVTGANSGLGRATTEAAARLGAEVLMLCRDVERGELAREQLLSAVPGARLRLMACDVTDLAALARVGEEISATVPALHGLVHNAGVLPPERIETEAGHELAFTTHVLGPHVLTDALSELLAADGDARVLFVTSGGMYTSGLTVGDPDYTRADYSGARAYARTKRMQVHLAEEWAKRLHSDGVTVHSTHPGWVGTSGLTGSLPRFSRLVGPLLRDPDEGADTIVWLLSAAEARERTGLLWHDRAPRPTSYLGRHAPSGDAVSMLWDLLVELTGVP